MADITTCREPGCPWCGSVITFDDRASHKHAVMLKLLEDAATPDPHWSDDTPHRYAWPMTD